MTEQKKSKKMPAKRLVVLGAVITVILGLSVATYASGALTRLADLVAAMSPAENPGQVLSDAYGDQISSQPVQLYDAYGNPIDMPVMQRQELDSEQAEELIGAYISDVDGTFTLGEDTFTLKNFLIDEDGNGLLIWTLENPNGAKFANSGYGGVYFPPVSEFYEPRLRHFPTEGEEKQVCLFNTLIRENEDGTQAEFATYFGTFYDYQPGDRFVWTIYNRTEEQSIEIIPGTHIGVKTLTNESGLQLGLSSHALAFTEPGTHFYDEAVVIHFQDGSQYRVSGEDIRSNRGSFMRRSEEKGSKVLGVLLNRLIDTEQVAYVEVKGIWHEPASSDGEAEPTEREETFLFYP